MRPLFAKLALAGVIVLFACAEQGCSSGGNGDGATGPMVFAPEATGEGAVVFLSARPTSGDRVVLDVVARGAAQIHGAAFRLTWDPESLALVSAESAGIWSTNALSVAKEGAPGQLAVAWTEKGDSGTVDATHDTVLGTVSFDVRGRKGSTLGFKIERSALVDRKGAHVPVTWRGGAVSPR